MGTYGDHRKRLVRELKRRIVEAGGKGVRVRGGRGTAWGWIDVLGSNVGDCFTQAQRKAIEEVTRSTPGGNFWCGEVEDVERILGIPSPSWEGGENVEVNVIVISSGGVVGEVKVFAETAKADTYYLKSCEEYDVDPGEGSSDNGTDILYSVDVPVES